MATKSPAKKAMAKTAPSRILIKKKESILLKEISFIEKIWQPTGPNVKLVGKPLKVKWKRISIKLENRLKHLLKPKNNS